MTFEPTAVEGVVVIGLEPVGDRRGTFARTWCRREFDAHGLDFTPVQCSLSVTSARGSIRGLHYQASPFGEPKLIRCTRGAVYDVILDIRPESVSFGKWMAIELTPTNLKMVFAPPGTAHGFQTLADDTEVSYWMGAFYEPGSATGVRWDDPFFGVTWPEPPTVISERDRSFPLWDQR